MTANAISCILSLFLCISFTSVASAEIYRCKTKQGGAVFTDNKFSCSQSAAVSLAVKPPTLYIERKVLQGIPDLSQRDPNADFPNSGRQYCAPVAVSNSLSAALGMAGSQQLDEQIDLARTLGSDVYMKTDEHDGTSPRQLLKGVHEYLLAQGLPFYNANKLEYHGQRSVPVKYNPNAHQVAELPWLMNGIKQEKHIWLNIGWYQLENNGRHKRIGGHWVTLVGYQSLGSLKDGKGEYLIVNDPATSGSAKNETLTVSLGNLNGRRGLHLLNQASKPHRADLAWVEGAIQLSL